MDKYLTYKVPAMSTLYMGLNTEVKPLGEKLVRQAMNYAVDKQGIVDAVYFGFATPSRGPLSPVIWGFDPARKAAYPYNPEKARELLKQAGYADGFDMTIYSDNSERMPLVTDNRIKRNGKVTVTLQPRGGFVIKH